MLLLFAVLKKSIFFNALTNPFYYYYYSFVTTLLHASDSRLLLTDYIKTGKIKEARNASKVDPQIFLGVESHSGFLTVNESNESNLFFWYFPHKKNVSETPWIIWLQGGPGATSLYGLFEEIGPFEYTDTLKCKFIMPFE